MPTSNVRYSVTDPYRVLGLQPGCTEADAKAAYIRLAKELHPDVSTAVDAPEKFRRVAEAYDSVLTRLKATSSGFAGAGGHAGYDSERMAARVREFRARAEEMRASRYATPKAQAAEAFWARLHHHAFETKLLLAIPAMLGLGILVMVFTEKEMERKREQARRLLPSNSSSSAKAQAASSSHASRTSHGSVRQGTWEARQDALPQSAQERAHKNAIRGHLLALATARKLPGFGSSVASDDFLGAHHFSRQQNPSQHKNQTPPSDTLPPSSDTLPPSSDTLPPSSDTLPPSSDTLPPSSDTLPPSSDTRKLQLPHPAGRSLEELVLRPRWQKTQQATSEPQSSLAERRVLSPCCCWGNLKDEESFSDSVVHLPWSEFDRDRA